MKMNKPIKTLFMFLSVLAGCLFHSCDIYDDAGDCSVHYKVPFTYTMNIQGEDAFAGQVSKVTLYVYDLTGNLVLRKTEEGDALKVPGYAMDVDLQPGTYNMLAWCEGDPTYEPPTAFVIGADDSAITGLSATLPLVGTGNEPECNKDIVPLFHGCNLDVELPDTYGDVYLPTMDLTKDTNIINVSIENIDGTDISPDALTVFIETDNSEMNWDNSLNGSRAFRHTPWCVTQFSSIREDDDSNGAVDDESLSPVTGFLAEFTTGRLMVNRKPMLVIHRSSDSHDIRLDLVQLLCMVRGHYKGNYTDQQYLDRMDFHELIFFVDGNLNWYTANGILINGWKVVPPQGENL